MSFGERIKQRREELSLTQEDVSAFISTELSRQTVSKWERDASYPEVDKLLLLSVKLDMSLDEMFADELVYLKRGSKKDSSEWNKFPGAIAGLKTFAEMLKTLNL